MNQAEERAEGGLKSSDTKRGLPVFTLLVDPTMRRVVGSDQIEGPVADRLDERQPVRLRTQRRVNLGERIVRLAGRTSRTPSRDPVVGHGEMVRSCLRGKAEPIFPSPANEVDSAGGRDVSEMELSTG